MKKYAFYFMLFFVTGIIVAQDPAIHVTQEGNVCVGNWGGSAKLHVWNGGILTDSYFGFYGGNVITPTSGTFMSMLPLSGNFGIYSDGQPGITIGRFGNNALFGIGIGDEQINYPFHVRAEAYNPMMFLESTSTQAAIILSSATSVPAITPDWQLGIDGSYPGKFTFQTIGGGIGPSVFFDQNGYNGFGIDVPEAVLHIRQYAWGQKDGFRISNASSVLNIYGKPGGDFHIDANTWLILNQDGQYVRIGNDTIPDYPLHMASGAHVTAGGVWTNASSKALKENIEDLTGIEAINALKILAPKKYNYKSEQGEQYLGFIAEDVPELVASGDRKSLSAMDMVTLLTKVVQEQQKRIELLEAKLDSNLKQE
jgi:hypothetical protein